MVEKETQPSLTKNLFEDFKMMRDPVLGKQRIIEKLFSLEGNGDYLRDWYAFSEEADKVYPDQGLILTEHDYFGFEPRKLLLPQEVVRETLRVRQYYLELFNHPFRINLIKETDAKNFEAPPKVPCRAIEYAEETGLALSIGDVAAINSGSDQERQQRTKRYAEGPFVKLGKQARILFTGSDSPDVWNSSFALSTMAASHGLALLPRNGIMTDIKRQVDLGFATFRRLEHLRETILDGREDADEVYNFWRRNLGAVLESTDEKALARASALYESGIRTFRIYSPEPGTEIVKTTKALRKEFGDNIEIFTGQVINVDQAKAVEEAGADGIFVGIGGGGRCITGVRSGSVIDWPMLVWNLRGEIGIPVIAEGGGSDHIGESLLLGASAISTSRVVAGGTIESPGGVRYCSGGNGVLFKPYGGEASARTKFLEDKMLPFNIPSFVEGETTKAEMGFLKGAVPTMAYNLNQVIENSILAMVFRNVSNITELHGVPNPLRRTTGSDSFQRNTH
jgi:hypothetical protein